MMNQLFFTGTCTFCFGSFRIVKTMINLSEWCKNFCYWPNRLLTEPLLNKSADSGSNFQFGTLFFKLTEVHGYKQKTDLSEMQWL